MKENIQTLYNGYERYILITWEEAGIILQPDDSQNISEGGYSIVLQSCSIKELFMHGLDDRGYLPHRCSVQHCYWTALKTIAVLTLDPSSFLVRSLFELSHLVHSRSFQQQLPSGLVLIGLGILRYSLWIPSYVSLSSSFFPLHPTCCTLLIWMRLSGAVVTICMQD